MGKNQSGGLFSRSMALIAVCACVFVTSSACAQPVWLGNPASVYATATNPFELAFGAGGVLFAGHHSPSNGAADIYRIPAGGGAAVAFGSITPEDPDGIDVYDGYVYASTEGPVYRTEITTGITTLWASASGSPNQSSMVIDKDGTYFTAGTAVVGNARDGADVELLFAGNPAQTLVSSPKLSVVRSIQFAAGGLYCTETLEDLGVWAIAMDGSISKVSDGGHSWSLPDAMVYQPSTDSFIVGDGANLYSLPRAGGTVQQVGSGFGQISGLTFDDAGHLYVSDLTNHVVWRVVPAPGAVTLFFAGAGMLIRRPVRTGVVGHDSRARGR